MRTQGRRVVVHIGYPKTGTTSLQRVCYASRDALASEGICYPHAGTALPEKGHHNLARSFWQSNPNGHLFRPELGTFEDVRAEWERSGCNTLLISSEGFTELIRRMGVGLIDSVCAALGVPQIEIVCCIRAPDIALEAGHLQRLQAWRRGRIEGQLTAFDPEGPKAPGWMKRYLDPIAVCTKHEKAKFGFVLHGRDSVSAVLRKAGIETATVGESVRVNARMSYSMACLLEAMSTAPRFDLFQSIIRSCGKGSLNWVVGDREANSFRILNPSVARRLRNQANEVLLEAGLDSYFETNIEFSPMPLGIDQLTSEQIDRANRLFGVDVREALRGAGLASEG